MTTCYDLAGTGSPAPVQTPAPSNVLIGSPPVADDRTAQSVMTGSGLPVSAILHACHLLRRFNCGECELPDSVGLVIRSGRAIDAT